MRTGSGSFKGQSQAKIPSKVAPKPLFPNLKYQFVDHMRHHSLVSSLFEYHSVIEALHTAFDHFSIQRFKGNPAQQMEKMAVEAFGQFLAELTT